MAAKLYDLLASEARVANMKSTIAFHQARILSLPAGNDISEQKNLDILLDMLSISEKKHAIILEVVLAREVSASLERFDDSQL